MRDRDLTACGQCGRRWSGRAECHCTVCHLHFGGVAAFDYHRLGDACKPLDVLLAPPANVARRFKVVQRSLGVVVVQDTARTFPAGPAHTCGHHRHPDDDGQVGHGWWDHSAPDRVNLGHDHATEDGTSHDIGCDGCLARYANE